MESTMKSMFSRTIGTLLIAAAGAIIGLTPSFAASSDHTGHSKGNAPAGAAMAEGLVKKIDRQKSLVIITHGPLPNGMPAMTMGFRPKDRAWLDQLKEGQKIRFTAEEVKGAMVLQSYEAVK